MLKLASISTIMIKQAGPQTRPNRLASPLAGCGDGAGAEQGDHHHFDAYSCCLSSPGCVGGYAAALSCRQPSARLAQDDDCGRQLRAWAARRMRGWVRCPLLQLSPAGSGSAAWVRMSLIPWSTRDSRRSARPRG
jgi:hypothetical protein